MTLAICYGHLSAHLCCFRYGFEAFKSLVLGSILRPPVNRRVVSYSEEVTPIDANISTRGVPQVTLEELYSPPNGPSSERLSKILLNAIEGVTSIFVDSHILFWKGKNFKGCFIPSKWKWYHRHGYWATRKKLLKFDTYRRHRYHEVRGPGKRPPSKWEDQSFYRPLRDSIKFW
ncbi:hypothetical protein X943_000211 [Babesia divergens]|uniref:Uncharacterized protein n=1 Tax=Babesia divergens TaxID=32595 RepID=A0AAD9LGG2_BABDI|nr:hypothetical protein X943_000211 [Babesia divergens]